MHKHMSGKTQSRNGKPWGFEMTLECFGEYLPDLHVYLKIRPRSFWQRREVWTLFLWDSCLRVLVAPAKAL